MLKRDERDNPKSCFNRAHDDEIVFVLLERDAAFPATIRMWAEERIRLGKNKTDDQQIVSALAEADEVEEFHRSGGKRKPRPKSPTIDEVANPGSRTLNG